MHHSKMILLLRRGLLALFLILITIASYLHITQGGGKAPSIHALCPYGGLESLYQVFSTGTFVSKIYLGTMILFIITLGIALLFRRSFCGLICPFGAIQEFLGLLGKKLFKRNWTVPVAIDKPLRYLKYGILAITVYYAWKTAGLWMAPYDPWAAYAHLSEGISSIWSEAPIAVILLGITAIGSLVYDRFFCKYLCPMGAFYAIVGKISPYKVVRNSEFCIDCGKCTDVCPMNIDVQHGLEIKTAECIQCSTCVLSCPKAGALELKAGPKSITPQVSLILVIGLFFGSIFIAQATGFYTLIPKALEEGETIPYSEVKGYMTIEDAAKATGTETDAFYKIFDIPESVPPQTTMKNISKIEPSYDFDLIKESFDPSTDTTPEDSPQSSIDVSAVKGSMSITESAEAIDMQVTEFYELFKIPKSVPADTKLKDISNLVEGYDFHDIKSILE